MFCPRCGKPLPPNAAFCMHCGQAIAPVQESSRYAAPVPVPLYSNPAAVAKKQNRNLAVILTAIAAIIIALIIGAAALLSAKNKAPQANLKSLGTGSAPPLAVKGQKMPKDIFDWLEHLRETEDRRQKLPDKEGTEAMANLLEGIKSNYGAAADGDNTSPVPPSIAAVQHTNEVIRNDWRELASFFDSVPPPDECIPIRNEFDHTLKETAAEAGDIGDALASSATDSTRARAKIDEVHQGHRENIDEPAKRANQMVQAICDKYNTKKWFDIRGDAGSGTLNQFLGAGIAAPIPGP